MSSTLKSVVLALIFVLSFVASVTGAEESRALEGLEVLRRGFAELNDFTAEITQEKQLALMKQKMISRGVVRFRKPGTFYMELYPPNGSRLLMRDNILTVQLPEHGTTDRMILPPDQSLGRWFDYLSKPITSLPEGMNVTAVRQGDSWTVHITPASKGGVRELELTFDIEGRIRRLAIEERNRDRTVIKFANLRRNTGLKDKDFRLH